MIPVKIWEMLVSDRKAPLENGRPWHFWEIKVGFGT
jgi:hypothetical protein